MNDILLITLRTILGYIVLIVMLKIMGKREIGQLGVIDLIVSILIAELVAISIENINDPLVLTVAPISVLVLIEIIFAFISIKSRTFRNFLDGKPSIIINKGVLNYKEMIKQRYSLDDLLLSLRQNNIKSIEDVEYAFLETNGKLSIFKYNLFKTEGTYPLALIVDGVIQSKTLKEIRHSKYWLLNYLNKQDTDLNNVFYAFYKNKKIYLIKYTDLKSV